MKSTVLFSLKEKNIQLPSVYFEICIPFLSSAGDNFLCNTKQLILHNEDIEELTQELEATFKKNKTEA